MYELNLGLIECILVVEIIAQAKNNKNTRRTVMKKAFFALLVSLLTVILISCATTGGADIPPVSRTAQPESPENHEYSENLMWDFICRYADEMFGDMEACTISKDSASRSILVEGFNFDSNVGFAAQSGDVEVRIVISAEKGKAACTVSYVDSFSYIKLGPITKKVSQGMTELGRKAYDANCQWLLDAFEYAIQVIAQEYALDNGWYEIPAYEEAPDVEEIVPEAEGMIPEDAQPVRLNIASLGKKLDDGSVIGELVKLNPDTWLKLDGLKGIYALDHDVKVLGDTALYNDEVIVLQFATDNDDNHETICILYPHSSDRSWEDARPLSYISANPSFLQSGAYDAYTILILSNLFGFKPGCYDVVITDDNGFAPAYCMVLEFSQRPDGFKYM